MDEIRSFEFLFAMCRFLCSGQNRSKSMSKRHRTVLCFINGEEVGVAIVVCYDREVGRDVIS